MTIENTNDFQILERTLRRKRLFSVSVVVALAALSSSALAVDTEAPARPRQERSKPPPAAFDACRSRREGDACTVEFGEQKLSGTCRRLPSGGDDLVCFPAGPPPAGGARP
jgi:hypothetical protein